MSLNSGVTHVLDLYKGAPVRRRHLVNLCGSPALLDQAGRLRNSRTVHAIPSTSGGKSLRKPMGTRGSPSARPKPRADLRCSAANRGPSKIESDPEAY
jgi:hypothetical protein